MTGKMVRIRTRRLFEEQKPWAFLGKVEVMSEHWIQICGKGIVIVKGKTHPIEIDVGLRQLLIPRENIANIRILPDDFDLDKIEICYEGIKIGVRVEGAPDAWISEMGES